MTDETPPGKKAEPSVPPPDGTPETTADITAEPTRQSTGATRFVWLLALIGVVALVATGFFAWQVSQRPLVNPAVGAMEQRIAAMEARLAAAREAAGRPVAAEPDRAMESRLAAIEAARDDLGRKLELLIGQVGQAARQLESERQSPPAPAAPNPETQEKLADVSGEIAAIRSRLDALRGEISGPIEQRLAPIEQRVAAIEGRPAPVLPDPQALYQLALDDLAIRIEDGKPFTAALQAVSALSRDSAKITAAGQGWADHAQTGIPTARALAERFAERAAAVSGAEVGDSWIDRALDRAARLVSIRRVDPDLPGTTPDAIVNRAQARLERGETAEALAEVENLPPASKERLGPWLAEAKARLAAETAISGLAGHTVPAGQP